MKHEFDIDGFHYVAAHCMEHSGPDHESPVAIALDRTKTLLASTLEDDDELADMASEIDPRALEKVRTFLRVLADNGAVCTLQCGNQTMRFTDVEQVKRSLARLAADNLHESKKQLQGQFLGVLPKSRRHANQSRATSYTHFIHHLCKLRFT